MALRLTRWHLKPHLENVSTYKLLLTVREKSLVEPIQIFFLD